LRENVVTPADEELKIEMESDISQTAFYILWMYWT
jgi:hypothetical protein